MEHKFLFEGYEKGKFLKRYKRFFVDVELDSGELVTAHCPNSGRMTSCLEEGWPVLLTKSNNPKRKLPYTFDYIFNGTSWIGVNTHRANAIVEEGLRQGSISELKGFVNLKREVPYSLNSRVDFFLTFEDYNYYLEVKSVTLLQDGWYQFPDSPSERAQKHLRDLMGVLKDGHRAGILFLVQRSDGGKFKSADAIDPIYSTLLSEAQQVGVDVMIYSTNMTEKGLVIDDVVSL